MSISKKYPTSEVCKPQILLVGSITHVGENNYGAHIVTGSHGGAIVAEFAIRARARSLICHDAGVGLDSAGIAGLALLDRHGIPAATIDYRSARIGDAHDMCKRGVISFVNDVARAAGVTPGQNGAFASRTLAAFHHALDQMKPDLPFERPSRICLGMSRSALFSEPVEVICLDSASQISMSDTGKMVLTGSHGGLPENDSENAIKAHVRLAVFNDAGIGRENAGIARLSALDGLNIPALTVSALSARIGDARSTYETGIVSRTNSAACQLGIKLGENIRTLFEAYYDDKPLSVRNHLSEI